MEVREHGLDDDRAQGVHDQDRERRDADRHHGLLAQGRGAGWAPAPFWL
jgi:hypothetical protein